MKHLPNLLTLANLFSGCIAIVFILNSQPYLASFNGEEYWVTATEQAYWGSVFIALAAIFDVLDGFTARALKVFSPIGKDLDSLADVVSFGVAPSMILFKMLWAAYMGKPGALDVSMLAMSPAFLVACFGALRLARFNISSNEQKAWFIGMPIPAAGLLVASFPLINWFNPMGLGVMFQQPWLLYAVIALVCWLMVSKVRFFKFIPAKWNIASMWPQLVVIAVALVAIPFINVAAIPLAFIIYIILSLVYQPKEA
ncbi:CDP-diacylglycerol--serine O-phosphatidyltransferase [Polluticoccus soli]|uniref:CDP-diacylglycerol--serine O-phosphatidyltransferase n=1 Tax=Polluticoccus soli TaxID=3034150 RepID=UPI0023E1C1F9|nr:CDP-diacylglycerol--serine O-phosphatidyltransferase [Flavipsychrobacter sp. JY13-12]